MHTIKHHRMLKSPNTNSAHWPLPHTVPPPRTRKLSSASKVLQSRHGGKQAAEMPVSLSSCFFGPCACACACGTMVRGRPAGASGQPAATHPACPNALALQYEVV